MDWIEIIELKSFTGTQKKAAVEAFHHLSFHMEERGLEEIGLYENPTVDQELVIAIHWNREFSPGGKSRLGLQLAAGFSEFGDIHHFGWRRRIQRIIRPQSTYSTQA